jgi:hypothetical protein
MEKYENEQSATNTIEPDIPKNLAKDFDEEIDDIFTKLGTLSPSNSSIDSPLILNRNKKFFNDFSLDIPHTLHRNSTNRILNYKNKFNSINTEYKTKKSIKNQNDYLNQTENINLKSKKVIETNSKKYKKHIFLNTHKKLKSDDIFFSKTFYFKENINNNLPIINETTKKNKNKEMKIINDKIEKIKSLLRDMKEIDSKLKKKDLKQIINNEFLTKGNEDNLHETIIQILDFIIDILNSIKSNKNKSNYKVGNEKIILKLKNELKGKEKQIGEIINNSKFEQEKLKEIINTNNIDLANLKKENKEMLNKISNYQKQISKIEINKEILEEKMNKIILEKTTKSINSSTSIRSTFIENISNKPKLENSISLQSSDEFKIDPLNMTQQLPQRYIPPSEQNKNVNNIKLNEKYNLSKKLNMNLLDLLKDINNFLCLYDSFLNKECGINKSKNMGNNIKSLVNYIDINALIEENKTKNFANEFMRNVENVYNKMEEFIKGINNKKEKGINKSNKINSTNNNESVNKFKPIKSDKNLSLKQRTKTVGRLNPK